jgi:hypothetical protein
VNKGKAEEDPRRMKWANLFDWRGERCFFTFLRDLRSRLLKLFFFNGLNFWLRRTEIIGSCGRKLST